MEELTPTARHERRRVGQPIRVGQRTQQPVAHVSGWSGGLSYDESGAWLHTMPAEVLVTDENGRTYRVPIFVRKNETMRWLALAGVLALPLNWLLRRTWRHYKN